MWRKESSTYYRKMLDKESREINHVWQVKYIQLIIHNIILSISDCMTDTTPSY